MTMKVLPVMITALTILAGSQPWAASRISTSATFRDALDDRIGSDGFGVYQDAAECVVTWAQGNMFFLRTVGSGSVADPPSCTATRMLIVDFSSAASRTPDGSGSDSCHVNDSFGQAGELDICGPNLLADVRVIADSLFAGSALRTGTTVSLPINLQPDFRNTAFSLEFEANAAVTGDSLTRTLATAPAAVAELYKGAGAKRKISVGRFYMGVGFTATKLQ